MPPAAISSIASRSLITGVRQTGRISTPLQIFPDYNFAYRDPPTEPTRSSRNNFVVLCNGISLSWQCLGAANLLSQPWAPDRNVKSVTSGGSLSRIGKIMVPSPRFVYRFNEPSLRNPHGYFRASGGR